MIYALARFYPYIFGDMIISACNSLPCCTSTAVTEPSDGIVRVTRLILTGLASSSLVIFKNLRSTLIILYDPSLLSRNLEY